MCVMETITDIVNEVWTNLKNQYEQDIKFQEELESLTFFYGRKFLPYANTDKKIQLVEEDLGDLVKSQFFQGYATMYALLNDRETQMDEKTWTAKKGIIRNEIPLLFDQVFENKEWYYTELGHSISMKYIEVFEEVYDLLTQIRKDVALYGAYKAFINDERYKGDTDKQNVVKDIIVDDIYDIEFLNPQIYIQQQFKTNEQRIYDLRSWSSLKNAGWVGSIHFSELPVDDSESLYLIEFTLSETIALNERYEIIKKIINKLPEEIRNFLQIRVYHTRELEILEPKQ